MIILFKLLGTVHVMYHNTAHFTTGCIYISYDWTIPKMWVQYVGLQMKDAF